MNQIVHTVILRPLGKVSNKFGKIPTGTATMLTIAGVAHHFSGESAATRNHRNQKFEKQQREKIRKFESKKEELARNMFRPRDSRRE